MEPEPYVWAIYVSSFAAVGRNKGYNQLYLIQLGEARKLGNRNERRREGKRWATLPPTVSDTVGFGYLSNVFFCGLLAPPRETCPGRRPQAPACFKSGDAQGTPGILDRMACGVALALAIGGVSCAADPPRGKKAALF